MPARERRAGYRSILVTGFEPFGGESINPSWEACELLPGEIGGLEVEKLRLPCEFRRSITLAARAIDRLHPVLVVGLGQAEGRARLGIERVAINLDDARIPDNAGRQPIDEFVAPNGPPAYFASLPVKAMAAASRAAGVEAEISNSAGTFVCNHLMYGMLHHLAESGSRARGGFIHVPYSPEQAARHPEAPSMPVAAMAMGIAAAIAAACEHPHDLHVSEGAFD
jgi:pyroglutamyl-peptidase